MIIAFVPSNSQSLLNKNQFQIKYLDFSSSNNQLPVTLQVQALVNGSLINMTLYQVQGLVNNISITNTKLYSMDLQIQQLQTQNIVINFFINFLKISIYILIVY